MPSNVVILPIAQASDGNHAVPTASKDMRRNDEYFLDKIAERWMSGSKQPGLSYRLERLPAGYQGFEHQRLGSKHVDRYLYGHPNGIFRSLNELFPHFKHLQDYNDHRGCTCKLCSKNVAGSASSSSRQASERPRATVPKSVNAPKPAKSTLLQRSGDRLPEGRLSDSPASNGMRKKQVDEEGTPDLYRKLIDDLKAAGPDSFIDEDITDHFSPDWRVGHDVLQGLLTAWSQLPEYVPRLGEIVLFTRSYNAGVSWDSTSQAFFHPSTGQPITWEAAVVTQPPTEQLSDEDLFGVPKNHTHNVVHSGFRLEPLSEVGNEHKPYTMQHKYVPLHAIRPFSMWKECVPAAMEAWHPTIKHALAIASSFCILGKYSFKGTWPEATLFNKAVYIGAELVMLGDTVKISRGDSKETVTCTDVINITSIRLRFIGLDRASDDDYDGGFAYQTALHITGKAFTLDPKRSFAGIGKTPATPGEGGLPGGLAAYGQWFHVLNPAEATSRLEVPYHRVLGRCHVETAVDAWYAGTADKPRQIPKKISQDLIGFKEAREYSTKHDSRMIPGKRWFWADTRIEQLDLHKINGKFVGAKDELRTPKQMNAWRQALKVLDGKKGSAEQYYAAQVQRQEEEKMDVSVSSYGMMGAVGRQEDSGAEDHYGAGDAMDIDDEDPLAADIPQDGTAVGRFIRDSDADDDDDDDSSDDE